MVPPAGDGAPSLTPHVGGRVTNINKEKERPDSLETRDSVLELETVRGLEIEECSGDDFCGIPLGFLTVFASLREPQ